MNRKDYCLIEVMSWSWRVQAIAVKDAMMKRTHINCNFVGGEDSVADQGQRNWSWRVQEAIAVKDAELEKKISIVIQLKEKLAGQTKAKETEAG